MRRGSYDDKMHFLKAADQNDTPAATAEYHTTWSHSLVDTTAYHSTALPPVSLVSQSCCCCGCSHITSHNQVRGHRTGSSHSGAEEYPTRKKLKPKVVHAYIHHI